MKAYLATTGMLFALLAVLHVWRIVVEWNGLSREIWSLGTIVAGIIVSAGLAIWALRLFLGESRG
ncbi:MAG TPA: hypothetical protein VKW08_10210 [Xanthobacteraceae bacterium]|jgi:tetrahydromethanopterin S-methyltransferase subunit E|nr:hypothetical protein [Xanthobacteraceae bacterium]